MHRLYLIRHCKAAGQEAEAPVTSAGQAQAEALAALLAGAGLERIVSSPMRRAVQSVLPLSRTLGLPVETDPRLAERVLGADPLPDWLDRLRESFACPDLRLQGGESLHDAQERALAVVEDILQAGTAAAAVATHGALLSALLRRFDPGFGFADWQAMTNPDLFLLTVGPAGTQVERLWR